MADKIDPTWSDVGEATSLELYKPTEYKKYSVASRNACDAGNLLAYCAPLLVLMLLDVSLSVFVGNHSVIVIKSNRNPNCS